MLIQNITKFKSKQIYIKIKYWTKLISVTGGAQAIVQASGLISGILFIRLLPVKEYAYYTIANTMLGTMTLLADGGISTSIMAQGGKVWNDKHKLGTVLATGLDLRKKFALGSLVVCLPILYYLLTKNGANWITTVAIIVSLTPAFFAALSDSILGIPSKLNQEIIPLQKNQLKVSLLRLVSGFTLYLFPWTFVAIIANGIPRIYGNIQLKKIAGNFITENSKIDLSTKKEILKVVRRVLPGAVYYCLSSQITIWLVSIFGNVSSIAQVGALSRISIVLTLFTSVISLTLVPRFSRLPNSYKILLNRFLLILILLTFLSIILIGIVYLFSSQILIVLGKRYITLNEELLLSSIGSIISMIAGVTYSLHSTRGWLYMPLIPILISIGSILIGVSFIDISTLKGILLFNIFISTIQAIRTIVFSLIKIKQLNRAVI
ncbi:hypothetical protein GCM10028808_45720 [Spirosoma migulaei]